MAKLINKSYPFDFGFRKRLVIAAWSGLGIFLFILFFQPFNIVVADMNNYLLLIAGFAGIAIILQLIIHLSIPVGKLAFRLEQYNLNILMLFELLIWILSSVAFTFYLRYVGGISVSIFIVFRIVLICLLQVIINMLIYEIYDLRLKLEQKEEAAKSDGQAPTPKLKQYTLELTSGNRSEKVKITLERLLFVRSAENYVEIHYLDKGEARMKLLRTTLKAIEAQLNPYPGILRCHRTCLVNQEKIEELKRDKGTYSLILSGSDEELPVSRQYLLLVKDYIENRV